MSGQKIFFFLLTTVFMLMSFGISAQWPSSDVYLCEVKWNQKNILVKPPALISGFNKYGYNNQPHFVSYHDIFITAKVDTAGTDIFLMNIEKKEFYSVTKTPKISEFSAAVIPSTDAFSTVRIEEDGKTQTLWQYPLDRSHYGKNIFPEITNVGYYAWINSTQVAMFLVDSSFSLVLGDTKTGDTKKITENIGRCLKSKNGFLFFTEKEKTDLFRIKKYDPQEQTIVSVFLLPEKTEDFEILPNGNIIFAQNGEIKILNIDAPNEPQTIINLEEYGIRNIKRIAAERDRIIFVNQP